MQTTHAQRSNPKRRYDAIVVGAGPTGLAAANMLARAGHAVAIFERHTSLYNLPRAGHVDDDVLRILQDIDCLDAVRGDFFPFVQMPLLGADGKMLFAFTRAHKSASSFISGSLYQPVLEDALYRQLQRHDGTATIYQGWIVDSADQDDNMVRVRARPVARISNGAATAPETFECRYLIAADGAMSSIRQELRIPREDFGCDERWLDVDVAYRRPCDFGPPAISGDPDRPHLVMPLGRSHHRFEWQLLREESDADFASPEKAWALLARKGVKAEDVEIIRQAVYKFEYRLARRWRENRIFLLGDAAHTMPPCLGQGMCSGIRDAANLGWKLDLVLRAVASTSILESYQAERYSNVKAWSDLSLKAGHVLCLTDRKEALARDARFRSGEVPAWRPPSALTTGLLDLSPDRPTGAAGQLFPQRTVQRGERIGLFDDVVGRGFLLVARSDARPFLSRADEAFRKQLDMQYAWLAQDASDASAFVDATGEYEAFFAGHGHAAVIVRPDHYVFGGVPRLEEATGLIARLQHALAAPEKIWSAA